jgi:CubicO group peptidase (beta-lactamase class C family)
VAISAFVVPSTITIAWAWTSQPKKGTFVLHRFAIILTAAIATLSAQDDPAARIDDIFKPWNKSGTPGAAVAVIRDGKLVFQKGYGIANLEYDVPISPGTIFHVASVSKQFTAMALVLLEQEGKLLLEDDIRKYLPELPDYGHKIAIRNLLQHTSGIRDQWQTLSLAGWRMDDVITQKQILRMLFHQKELNFEPGTRHLYSNGGYTLAAEIVARVSGKPLPEFCDERIFRPLGMTHTHFHDDHRRIVRDRAYSYEKTGDGFRASPLNYANAGATSLFTTAPDLVKWLDNFRDPKVGGPKAIVRLQEQAVLTNGEKVDYALGLAIGKFRGLRTVSHGGADAGYRSYVVWFPDQQLGVAVVGNLATFDTGGVANRVAEVYLEQKMTAAPAVAKPVTRQFIKVDPATLDRYAGSYRLSDMGLVTIQVKDGRLLGSPQGQPAVELKPVAPGRFYVELLNGEVEFTPQDGGKMRMKLSGGGLNAEGERVIVAPFDSKDLAQYSGAYWSDELETQYTIVVRDGKLVADHSHHGEISLTPVSKDQFRGGTFFMQEVSFVRDGGGRVTGMTVGGGRVTAVRFTRR